MICRSFTDANGQRVIIGDVVECPRYSETGAVVKIHRGRVIRATLDNGWTYATHLLVKSRRFNDA